jgi:hypothetical protein
MRIAVRTETDAFHIAVGMAVLIAASLVLGALEVGDASSAFGVVEDELREHGADEVIISTYPRGRSNWIETGIVERLRDELEIPVTHVVVQPVAQPAAT